MKLLAQPPWGGYASSRLDHGLEFPFLAAASLESVQFQGRHQVSCQRSLQEDQTPTIQGSLPVRLAPAVRMLSCHPQTPLDSLILVFLEDALAADLITA